MTGLGIVRGIWVTFKHLMDTYLEDIRAGRKRYRTPEGIDSRRSSDTRGIFTIQYPEEKMPVPEEFRVMPFLVYDEGADGKRNIRCTACGICSKVCPTQCIYIFRSTDPNTGRPVPTPAEYYIDTDKCMNCGSCAEFCPFDAVKMDHDYEIADYERKNTHIYNLEKLLKPASYYQSIRPLNSAEEEQIKAQKEAAKANKAAATPA